MIGPPGTGKTLLAKRLPTILPPLTPAESLETTRIYSAMGLSKPGQPLMTVRPFRPPHHSVSDAGLVGGCEKWSSLNSAFLTPLSRLHQAFTCMSSRLIRVSNGRYQ